MKRLGYFKTLFEGVVEIVRTEERNEKDSPRITGRRLGAWERQLG
jgi:hypothetical protein